MMSFSSPYVIKKILDVFRVDTHVIYVAILDYEGNIKAQLVRDENENTSLFEARCIDGARATYGMYQASKQFFDVTNLITISNDTNTEFIHFSDFVIYVLTEPIEDEEKAIPIKNKIRKLEDDLQKIFDSTIFDLKEHDQMHSNR